MGIWHMKICSCSRTVIHFCWWTKMRQGAETPWDNKKKKKSLQRSSWILASSQLSRLSIYRRVDRLLQTQKLQTNKIRGRKSSCCSVRIQLGSCAALLSNFFYGGEGLHHALPPANTVWAPRSSPANFLCKKCMAELTERTHTHTHKYTHKFLQ